MASAIVEHVADLAWSVLEVDVSATALLRNMYPSAATISDGLSYFTFDFPETLLDILNSDAPPSLAQLLSCSLHQDLDLLTRWVVYLQFYVKNGEVTFGVYCGSSLNQEGAQLRINMYKAFAERGSYKSLMPTFVKGIFKEEGWQYLGYTVLAAASIFGDGVEYEYLKAAINLLEGMFTAKLWAFKSKVHGSLTGACLWDANELPYFGLCHHSPLMEVNPPRVLDVFENPDMKREWEEDRKERLAEIRKNAKETQKRYEQSEEGKAIRKARYQSEKFKQEKKAYAASEKGQATQQKRLTKIRKGGSGKDFFCKGVGCTYTSKTAGNVRMHEKTCKVVGGHAQDFFCSGVGCVYSSAHKGNVKTHEKTCKKVVGVNAPDFFCKGVGCVYSSKHESSVKRHEKTCKKVAR